MYTRDLLTYFIVVNLCTSSAMAADPTGTILTFVHKVNAAEGETEFEPGDVLTVNGTASGSNPMGTGRSILFTFKAQIMDGEMNILTFNDQEKRLDEGTADTFSLTGPALIVAQQGEALYFGRVELYYFGEGLETYTLAQDNVEFTRIE